jgi:spermidine/putrescine transport system substrate-binding protein
MRDNKIFRFLTMLVLLSLILTACGGGNATPTTQAPATEPPATEAPATEALATEAPATEPPAATEAPATEATSFTSVPSDKTTSTGFVCPEPNPRVDLTSQELNIFVWTEYIPQDLLDCFELVYGIKVNRDEYSSNEEMYPKLAAGSSAYDIVQPTDYFIQPMIRNNLIQKLDKSKLTILGNFAPEYLNQPFDPNNEYTVPYEVGMDAIVVNTDKVKDVPKSWADLWKPEYQGHMVFLDDTRAVIGATLLSLGYDVNTKDPKQLDEAKAKLAELVPGIKLFDSDSPKTALIAGDVDLGLTWTFEALAAQQAVPSIQFVYPTEGAMVWQDNYAIPTGAPHLDAAYAWLNYSYQPDIFWLMLRDFAYINPDKAALDFAENSSMEIPDANGNPTTPAQLYEIYLNSNITNPPADAIKNAHRIDDVGDATPLYEQIWTEVKGQ